MGRLVIGLFGLVGMVGVGLAPPLGRLIDSLVPWFASVIACVAYILTHVIMVGADGINVAAVVIVCIGIDVFRQMVQVSLTTAVFSLDPAARSRMNAIILISVCCTPGRYSWFPSVVCSDKIIHAAVHWTNYGHRSGL